MTTVTEVWVPVPEYETYAVSNHGRVINTHTDLIKNPATNQQGILMVNLSHNGQQHVRSVALLVATAFLARPSRRAFDTPIHLDGNKRNCGVWNLMWRPRWFARKYHQQFDPWERANRFGFRRPVHLIDTGEVFPTSWEAATKYGLLDFEIMLSIQNHTVVFPTHQRFELIEN